MGTSDILKALKIAGAVILETKHLNGFQNAHKFYFSINNDINN